MSFFNPWYLLLILPAWLAWFAQDRVQKVYQKYGAQRNSGGRSGLEIAKYLLHHHRLGDVTVERVPGQFTDHYDPQTQTLRLSDAVAGADSVTALGVVAHEVGHAVQNAEGYRPMQVRGKLAERLSQAAGLSSAIFVGGMLFGNPLLMGLGVVMLAAMTFFAVVTLPVERDASNRALAMLDETGLASPGERKGARQVLRAAALTYAAALGRRLATFLFFVGVVAAARLT